MYSVIMVLFALNGALQDCKELFLTSKKKEQMILVQHFFLQFSR